MAGHLSGRKFESLPESSLAWPDVDLACETAILIPLSFTSLFLSPFFPNDLGRMDTLTDLHGIPCGIWLVNMARLT